MTNRELYLAVVRVAGGANAGRTLEAYLRALWGLCGPLRGEAGLGCERFVELLERGLTAEAPAFEEAWGGVGVEAILRSAGFERFELAVKRQVVDLREMEAAGTLANPERYFGVFAPRGSRWYNFDVATFLECGAVGTFGGWEPGDAGRELVPGEVTVMGEEGFESVPAEEVERPVYGVGEVGWETFAMFLGMGQSYE